MNVSLDGYITDPAGSLDWSVPSREVFRFHIDQIRGVDVHLLGRRLYETMLYWETADQNPDADADDLEWTALWKALPRVVFSNSLTEVIGARLASGSLEERRHPPSDLKSATSSIPESGIEPASLAIAWSPKRRTRPSAWTWCAGKHPPGACLLWQSQPP